MYEEVILVGNKCDFEEKKWEVDTHTGEEVNIDILLIKRVHCDN